MFRGLVLLALPLLFAAPALAQDAQPQPKKLTLKAAPAPVPALKYRLLPEVRELQPGNAFVCYLRAMSPELSSNWRQNKVLVDLEKLLEMPFEEFKVSKKPDINIARLALAEIDQGARREYCDWEMLTRLRKDGIATLVPEVQVTRSFGQLLAYRTRLALEKGDFDKATNSLQTMLSLSRHVAEAPVLIHALVGKAIASHALDQVEDAIQQPNAPNLYWALTALPRPFIDPRRAYEAEMISLEASLPELRKMMKEPLSEGEMQRLINVCADTPSFGVNPSLRRPLPATKTLELVGKVASTYPAARKSLIDGGRKVEDVDKLPMLQVVVMQNFERYKATLDDVIKWTYVPFWQSERSSPEFQKTRDYSVFPFYWFTPDIGRFHEIYVQLDRRIEALRCIEAVRLHLAQTGKVPGALEEMKAVPIPIDPITGKQFDYAVRDNVVTLFGPAPKGRLANEYNVVNYQITFKK